MPTYEYLCKACGHQLEVFQKISDEPLQECPKCHQGTLNKLISAANFQLKGTGWYATDFKDKGKPKEKTAPTDEKPAAKSDDSSKTDSSGSNTSTSTSSDKAAKTGES